MGNVRGGALALVLAMALFGCGDDNGSGGMGGAGGMAGMGGAGGMAGMADPCMPNPCMNGGTCMNVGGNAECNCADTGFMGPTCETDEDECDGGLGPCDPMGASACTNTPGSYECTCNSGYEGMDCDMDIDECNGGLGPCDTNGASACTNTPGSYECTCNSGYDGMDCDTCSEGFALEEGMCVPSCEPAPGRAVVLPMMSPPQTIGSYDDNMNGFRATSLPENQLASGGLGFGVAAVGSSLIQPGETVEFAFVEDDNGTLGAASSVSNLSMTLARNTLVTARFEAFDAMGGQIGGVVTSTTTVPNDTVNVSALFGNSSISRLTVTVDGSGNMAISELTYDHDCL